MKPFSTALLIMLLVFCVGCANSEPTVDLKTMPNDFAITYDWRRGSVAPPYHYEYSITIKPSGDGEMTMIPDYPADTVPKWTETFKVEESDLKQLYQVLIDNGLFTQKWQQVKPQPVGGDNQTLKVTAHGKQITVDNTLIPEQEAPADKMYTAVQQIVPKDVWDSLHAKQQQYMSEHLSK